jgi:hypothetical protein
MRARVKRNVWADKGTVTDCGQTCVEENGVEVDEDILAETHVVAVVHGQRRLDPGVIFK